MIIEIALGIVLAVFILAYLGEILALGAIVIVIGIAVAALVIAAIVIGNSPMLSDMATIAFGVLLLWGLFHFGKGTEKKATSSSLASCESDEILAKHKRELEEIAAKKHAEDRRNAQCASTFILLVVATISLGYRAVEFFHERASANFDWDGLVFFVILWLVFVALFYRAQTKPLDESFFRMPGG